MYDLPQFNSKKFQQNASRVITNKLVQGIALVIVIVVALGFASGTISVSQIKSQAKSFWEQVEKNAKTSSPVSSANQEMYTSKIGYEQAIIDTVKSASPSVVSIIISKNLPVYTQQYINPFGDNSPFGDFLIPQQVQNGTKLQEVGAGSGFIVSEDGLIVTNRHVVSDAKASYTVITNDGKKYTAKVLALDPVQDLAIIKISGAALSDSTGTVKKFPAIKLGDSGGIQIGQGAIAIGNALGEFSNTVSVGVVSGLGRTVSASDQTGDFSETLEGIIQTDAAINPGNSGGPLLNLQGEVVGVNTAMAQGAQSIGFVIPINIAKKDLDQIIKTNKITYPFLGVRYVLVNDTVQAKYKLSVDYGAYVLTGDNGEVAVTKGSAADKAGIKEKDVILEVNGEKITSDNSMSKIIQKYNPGDKVTLQILRGDQHLSIDVTLGERSQ